ncbi:MAG: tetratricopeptide repeat protein [Bacteroidota bacterium]
MRNLSTAPAAMLLWLFSITAGHSQSAISADYSCTPSAAYLSGSIQYDSSEWAEAAHWLRKAVDDDPQMADAWYNLALTYYKMGDFLETERLIERVLSIDPFYERAHKVLGMALYQRGEYPRAIKAFNYAIEKEGASAELRLSRAICFIADNRPKFALPDLDDILHEDPGHPRACLAKSAALIDLEQPAYAIRFLNRMLENDPANVQALTNRAICQYQLGHQEKAAADFVLAIAIQPTLSTLIARAKCSLSSGQFQAALADIRKAIQLDANAPMAYYVLGEIEMGLGKFESAIESFDIALHLDHTCLDCRILKSEAAANLTNFTTAISDIYSILAEEPNNETARDMLIWVYAKMDEERSLNR